MEELKKIQAVAMGTVVYTYEYRGVRFYYWRAKYENRPYILGRNHTVAFLAMPRHLPQMKEGFTNKEAAITYAKKLIDDNISMVLAMQTGA